mmetsp:Transcript_49231/g.137915  ORF Transcript_49231/g.137915 Transcript_49231/m.137915 type:complete len:244 (+) Transcript_49231:585-1316(+)
MRPWLAMSFSSFISSPAANESKPLVGSSKSTIEGFVMSSTPTEVRFLSPPEMPLTKALPMKVSLQLSRPKPFNSPSTFRARSDFGAFGNFNAELNSKDSSTVCVGKRASSCITKATHFFICSGVTSWSPASMVPLSWKPFPEVRCRPAKTLSKVDFPAPEGPRMHASCPGRSSPEMLVKIFLSPTEKDKSHHWTGIVTVSGIPLIGGCSTSAAPPAGEFTSEPAEEAMTQTAKIDVGQLTLAA